jgi:hypothetical protein
VFLNRDAPPRDRRATLRVSQRRRITFILSPCVVILRPLRCHPDPASREKDPYHFAQGVDRAAAQGKLRDRRIPAVKERRSLPLGERNDKDPSPRRRAQDDSGGGGIRMTGGRFNLAWRDSFSLCRESKWRTPRRRLGGSADLQVGILPFFLPADLMVFEYLSCRSGVCPPSQGGVEPPQSKALRARIPRWADHPRPPAPEAPWSVGAQLPPFTSRRAANLTRHGSNSSSRERLQAIS